MAIYVQLDAKERLKSYLIQDDADYAQWLFNKYEQPGDILATVTPERYDKLCANSRYRAACLQAAKSM